MLKIDSEKQRISLGLKQLQPDPWDSAADKYKTGERVRGTVSRVSWTSAPLSSSSRE